MRVKKKGETIIEVVVAMSVLAIVFLGVFSLISGIVGIARASRDRTSSTVMAQKGLNTYKRNITDTCSPGALTSGVDLLTQSPAGCYSSILAGTSDGKPCNYMEVITSLNTPYNVNGKCMNCTEKADLTTAGLDPAAFQKIISHVTWTDKQTGRNEIQVSELVRKK